MTQRDGNPRILLITRNLPPLVGGMERMMHQLALGIDEYADLTVIGPRGCKAFLPDGMKVHECSARLGPFLLLSTLLAVKVCRQVRFDVIIGGSGLIGPTLHILSLLFRSRTLVYLHGLDLVVNSALYQLFFVACLRRIDSVAVNSRNTLEIAVRKGLERERIVVINPGTRLPDPVDSVSREDFRRRYSIPFARFMVFTGRMTKRKGLSGFLRHTYPAILKSEPGIGLVVVGEDPQDSLNKLGEQSDIRLQIMAGNLQDSVVFLGKLTDRDLETCYAEASVQVFPLVEVSGDVEGFGMVAIEAAACGTPTVAFELGGVADAISAQNGYLVSPGDFLGFAERVAQILRTGKPDSAQCIAHARQFSWQNYNQAMRARIEASLET